MVPLNLFDLSDAPHRFFLQTEPLTDYQVNRVVLDI